MLSGYNVLTPGPSRYERRKSYMLPVAVALGVLAIGAGAEFGFVMGKQNGKNKATLSPTGHVYHSGDHLQLGPSLPARIEGWKVVIDKNAVENFNPTPTVNEVEIDLMSQNSG